MTVAFAIDGKPSCDATTVRYRPQTGCLGFGHLGLSGKLISALVPAISQGLVAAIFLPSKGVFEAQT